MPSKQLKRDIELAAEAVIRFGFSIFIVAISLTPTWMWDICRSLLYDASPAYLLLMKTGTTLLQILMGIRGVMAIALIWLEKEKKDNV